MDAFDFDDDESGLVDRFLADRIYEFNVAATTYADGESFASCRRDDAGSIVAGVSGYTWGGCCYVAHLWVAEAVRNLGVGRALLLATEARAKGKGCAIVLLSSHSFQSPGFYEKLGYVAQAAIADHPVGHANIVFAKRLT
jgi:GNAT superfamily N-acetyltransferase